MIRKTPHFPLPGPYSVSAMKQRWFQTPGRPLAVSQVSQLFLDLVCGSHSQQRPLGGPVATVLSITGFSGRGDCGPCPAWGFSQALSFSKLTKAYVPLFSYLVTLGSK